MIDLYAEIERRCSYEIRRSHDTLLHLPSYTDDAMKADIVKHIFTHNGGGVGWGLTCSKQIEIDAEGAKLYELINGTSGNTKTLQQISFMQLMRMIEMTIDTSAEVPTEKEVFAAVADEFAERCAGMLYADIISKYKGCSPHGGSYIRGWQICYWNNHVEIAIPYRMQNQVHFKDYKYTYEKIAKAVVMLQGEYAETKTGQLQFKI